MDKKRILGRIALMCMIVAVMLGSTGCIALYKLLTCDCDCEDVVVTPTPVPTESPTFTPTPVPTGIPTPTPTPITITYLINEPLTDGVTQGQTNGEFVSGQGLRIPGQQGYYLAYETGVVLQNFQLEMDTIGFIPGESDGADGKLVIAMIHDGSLSTPWLGGGSEWEQNALMELRRRTYPTIDGALHWKYGARGNWNETRFCSWLGGSPISSVFSWNASVKYHWTLRAKDGVCSLLRDDYELPIFSGACPEWNPLHPVIVIIGGTPTGRAGSAGVIYSNIKLWVP